MDEKISEEPPAALPLLADPDVFRVQYAICKVALLGHSGNRQMRDMVNSLAFAFRKQALKQFGHEVCFEESALAGLLRDTDYRTDTTASTESPVERLYRLEHLGNPERNAAALIEQVWAAFDKFLGARSTNFSQGSGGGFRGIVPMGVVLSQAYRQYYSPWYEMARNRRPIVVGTRKIRHVDVVFHMVVNRRPLKQLADAYGVNQQDLIEILRGELLSLASRMDDGDAGMPLAVSMACSG